MTTKRDLIEIARAKGWDLQRTCTELGVTPGKVMDVWHDQDLLANEGRSLESIERRKAGQ